MEESDLVKSIADKYSRIKVADLVDIKNPQAILAYGMSGTGKTSLLATAPKPLALISIKDKGEESAKSSNLSRGDIVVIEVDEFNGVFDAFDFITDHGGFKSIGLDHLTALLEQARLEVKEAHNVKLLSLNQHQDVGARMKEVIDTFISFSDRGILPIALAQEKYNSVEEEEGGSDQVRPYVACDLPPALQGFAHYSFRTVVQLYLYEVPEKIIRRKNKEIIKPATVEFRIRTGQHPDYRTKFTMPRDNELPDYLIDGTIEDLTSISEGTYES